MRKRYLLFMFIFLFICVGRVNAKEWTCSYKVENGLWNLSIYYKANDSDNTLEIGNESFSSDDYSTILDFYVSSEFKSLNSSEKIKKFIGDTNGKCQKSIIVVQGNGSNYGILIDSQFIAEVKELTRTDGSAGIIGEKPFLGCNFGNGDCSNNTFYANVDEDKSKDASFVDGISTVCSRYISMFKEVSSYFGKCNKNNVQACYDFNTVKSKIKTFCNTTLNYGSFNNPCVVSCLGLEQELANIENSEINEGTCNVSDKILKLIKNVFKWGKYIAPVLVIILSILDFIKALAAQNDDEMKKAQGRFVKRLISAALLFIIPFLIEFALDTFHLVSDNPYCDII